jgi:hypothetical protein
MAIAGLSTRAIATRLRISHTSVHHGLSNAVSRAEYGNAEVHFNLGAVDG